MKQKNKKIIAIVIIALTILAGLIVVAVLGFNKELKFQQCQRIDIYVEQYVDEAKVKNIANEVLGKSNIVQSVEIYKDMVTIRAKNITEEQKNSIVNKVKENYEFEQTAETTTIYTVAETRFRDMYKQYILPFVISAVLVTIYMVIRYYKKGVLKVLTRTVIIPIVAQLILLSLIAITRIPMGRFIPSLVVLTYIASILYVIKENEK